MNSELDICVDMLVTWMASAQVQNADDEASGWVWAEMTVEDKSKAEDRRFDSLRSEAHDCGPERRMRQL